jgi:DNA-nicking Smr family endonuclease
MNHQAPGDDVVEYPVDGVLDLHTFRPGEVKELIPEYLALCRDRDIFSVRIIHGKGTGRLRTTVHAILSRTPGVRSFRLAGEDAGGWGATLVELYRCRLIPNGEVRQ